MYVDQTQKMESAILPHYEFAGSKKKAASCPECANTPDVPWRNTGLQGVRDVRIQVANIKLAQKLLLHGGEVS